jgi:DNA adenine methylase Dam
MSVKSISFTKSPLNYTGGKYKLLHQIICHFPKIKTFYDVFAGGGSVFINTKAESFFVNDIDSNLIELYRFLKSVEYEKLIESIESEIEKYKLSNSFLYGYEHYLTDSSKGLGEYNKSPYLKLKKDFNDAQENILLFFLLICYGFNNQIRYNKKRHFNIPVGKRDFNSSIRKNLYDFMISLQSKKIKFSSISFTEIPYEKISSDDFLYFDPPYLITNASYNENGNWNKEKELELLQILDFLLDKKIGFALSNMISVGDIKNEYLNYWLKINKNNVRVIRINSNYSNSNYQKKNNNLSLEKEILVLSKR